MSNERRMYWLIEWSGSTETSGSRWKRFDARIAAAHTVLRELRGANAYVFEATRFRNLKTPTLLLLGENSPAYFKTAIEAVHNALSESQVRIMAGQQHKDELIVWVNQ